ncbi:hypothetical protein ACFP3I_05510 [Chryseobacterium arachidis]
MMNASTMFRHLQQGADAIETRCAFCKILVLDPSVQVFFVTK